MASSGCYWECSPVINVNAAAAVAIKNFNYEKYKFFVIISCIKKLPKSCVLLFTQIRTKALAAVCADTDNLNKHAILQMLPKVLLKVAPKDDNCPTRSEGLGIPTITIYA